MNVHNLIEQFKYPASVIIEYLIAQECSVKEYLLLKYLEDKYPDFFHEIKDSSSLYKKHFFLFYHLYKINDQLLEYGWRIIMSPLMIELLPCGEKKGELGKSDELRKFYTNKDNLQLSESEIIEMQKAFWEKYLAIDQKAKALKVLGLESLESIDAATVKKRFNELAQKHHPDKGGEQDYFIELRDAYNHLKVLF
ncbi:DNA-J related domain-containing protein [Aliikangiella sp. IMCC44359]|uniref:DNA-J related domain-containing protein n=1 Tax=Aliikangiella sp. IMCC44359 TaxID=3459125 RepID=UPI00403AA4BD